MVDGRHVAGDVSVDVRSGVVDAVGLSPPGRGTAIPGLVDLQVNGGGSCDLRTAGVEEVRELAVDLAAAGATAFQPTIHSAPVEVYRSALSRFDGARSSGHGGARILGAHLEGPCLAPEWAGAHDPAHLLPVDPALLDDLLSAGRVAMVTIAPELEGALDVISDLCRRGVVVAIGHTDADADTVRAALDRGATYLTHCWNAHRRFTPRDPGPAGVALSDPRLTVGLIADGQHVAVETVLLTLGAAAGRVALTTDSVAWTDDPGVADAPLRGGRCSPVELLRRLRSSGLGWDVVVDACCTVPARVAGLGPHTLEPGTTADLVVLDDALAVVRTLVGGVEVAAPGAPAPD